MGAKPFNAWTGAISGDPIECEGATFEDMPTKSLIVPITSETGLCGGVNSFISRTTKAMVTAAHAAGKECDIVIIGEKGRSRMGSAANIAPNVQKVITDCNHPPSFSLVAALSAEILDVVNKGEYDGVVLVYNSYVNAAVYKQKYKIIKPFTAGGDLESMVE